MVRIGPHPPSPCRQRPPLRLHISTTFRLRYFDLREQDDGRTTTCGLDPGSTHHRHQNNYNNYNNDNNTKQHNAFDPPLPSALKPPRNPQSSPPHKTIISTPTNTVTNTSNPPRPRAPLLLSLPTGALAPTPAPRATSRVRAPPARSGRPPRGPDAPPARAALRLAGLDDPAHHHSGHCGGGCDVTINDNITTTGRRAHHGRCLAWRATRVRWRKEPKDGRGRRAKDRAAEVGQRRRLELQRPRD